MSATSSMLKKHEPVKKQQLQHIGMFDSLSWRMSPSETYSDWTIEIVRPSTCDSTVIKTCQMPQVDGDYGHHSTKISSGSECVGYYHVHRNILAVGPRHSEYFAAQFQLRMQENKDRTSRIELDDAQAEVFPWLLDFIYSLDVNELHDDHEQVHGNDELERKTCNSSINESVKVLADDKIVKYDTTTPKQRTLRFDSSLTVASAAALYSLADYLDIPSLRGAVQAFYRDRLSIGNLVEYVSAARQHHADCLVDAAAAMCVEHLLDIDPVEAARYLEPEFLLQVLEARSSQDENGSDGAPRRRRFGFHVSKLIAECCNGEHRDKLTRDVFDRLTDKNVLPYMDSRAAVRLMSLDAKLPARTPVSIECPHKSFQHGKDGSPASTLSLSCLQRRCAQSISEKWKSIRSEISTNKELARSLEEVSSNVLVDILMRTTSDIRLREDENDEYDRENLKDPPPRILVDGSGTTAVNGIYIRDGYFQGICKYSKVGQYKGNPCKFTLYKCLVGSQTKRWFIGVVPGDVRPGTRKDVDFFSALATSESELIPPHTGWFKATDGAEPGPLVLF